MNFVDQVWNKILPIYNSIQSHPFSAMMMDGKVDEKPFACYLSQTLSLLMEFSGAISLILAKANHASMVADLLRAALAELENERTVCYKLLSNTSNHQEIVLPSCIAYTNFLTARAAADDIPVAIAVILPRFFLWHNLASTTPSHSKAYATNHCMELLGIYKSANFHTLIGNATDIANEIAHDQSPIIVQRMEEAFIHSALFQWHFLQDILTADSQRFAVWNLKDKPREVRTLALV